MNNEKFSDFYAFYSSLGENARKYLRFVAVVFVMSGIVCAGLYLHLFGMIDRVNSYILAEELLHSMIRSTTAATILTLLLDLAEKRCEVR